MPPLPTVIMQAMSVFAPFFTQPTFRKVLTLVGGTILAPQRRTVAAALRAMGLGEMRTFGNYHRVLNRDRWPLFPLAGVLLRLLVTQLPTGAVIRLIIDETVERRGGDHIEYAGWFRDLVRSTGRHLATVLGVRWLCLCVLVTLPWTQRPWALPFLVVPTLGKAAAQRLHRPHRTLVGWAIRLIRQVRRWLPQPPLLLVGDGSYAAIELVRTCQHLPPPVTFVSRLRLDACLHAFPQRRSKYGPMPKRGARLPSPDQVLTDPQTAWQPLIAHWYSGQTKTLEAVSGVCLWAKQGVTPVPIRWVLLRCPTDPHFKPQAFLASDVTLAVPALLDAVLARWNIEVTFAELRAHFGFETQRQWTRRAIQRTTPCLCGLFSLVVLCAKLRHPTTLPLRQTAWYAKPQPTFADALAVVRREFWTERFRISSATHDLVGFPDDLQTLLLEAVCYST